MTREEAIEKAATQTIRTWCETGSIDAHHDGLRALRAALALPPSPATADENRDRALVKTARQAGGVLVFRNFVDRIVRCATCEGEGTVIYAGPNGEDDGDSEQCEDCMGEGVAWPDALFAEVERSAKYDDACIASIIERVAFKHPRAPQAASGEVLADAYRWIAREHGYKPARDHACAQCVPGGDVVIAGFACIPHRALAALASPAAAPPPETKHKADCERIGCDGCECVCTCGLTQPPWAVDKPCAALAPPETTHTFRVNLADLPRRGPSRVVIEDDHAVAPPETTGKASEKDADRTPPATMTVERLAEIRMWDAGFTDMERGDAPMARDRRDLLAEVDRLRAEVAAANERAERAEKEREESRAGCIAAMVALASSADEGPGWWRKCQDLASARDAALARADAAEAALATIEKRAAGDGRFISRETVVALVVEVRRLTAEIDGVSAHLERERCARWAAEAALAAAREGVCPDCDCVWCSHAGALAARCVR